MSDTQGLKVRVSRDGGSYCFSTDDGATWSGWRDTRLEPLPGGYTISFETLPVKLDAPLPLALPDFTRALLSRP